jgi:hypothetical protein
VLVPLVLPAPLLLPPPLPAQLLPHHRLLLLQVALPALCLLLAQPRLHPALRLTVPPLSVDTLLWLLESSVLPLLLSSKEVVALLA